VPFPFLAPKSGANLDGTIFFGIHYLWHRSLAAVPSGESFLSLSFCFCPLFPSYCLLCFLVVPIQIVIWIGKPSLWAEWCTNFPLIFFWRRHRCGGISLLCTLPTPLLLFLPLFYHLCLLINGICSGGISQGESFTVSFLSFSHSFCCSLRIVCLLYCSIPHSQFPFHFPFL